MFRVEDQYQFLNNVLKQFHFGWVRCIVPKEKELLLFFRIKERRKMDVFSVIVNNGPYLLGIR